MAMSQTPTAEIVAQPRQLTSIAHKAPGATTTLLLPCGHYYVDSVNTKTLTSVAQGNAALYVGGNFTSSGAMLITVSPRAQLDIFVKGKLDAKSSKLGSNTYPSHVRFYVYDNGGTVPGDSVSFSSATKVAANFYTPWNTFAFASNAASIGSIFSKAFTNTASTNLTFDRNFFNVGDQCPSPCGNPPNRRDPEYGEVCDGTDLGGATCTSALGIAAASGTLLCDPDCKGFNTNNCYFCGDGLRNGNEQCEGAGTTASCTLLGYTSGLMTCRNCQYDQSACDTCGDGFASSSELCDTPDFKGTDCTDLGPRYYNMGSPTCTGTCTLSAVGCHKCGDNVVDAGQGEQCDGTDGRATCADFGYTTGTPVCGLDCLWHVSGCSFCGNYLTEKPTEQCDGAERRDRCQRVHPVQLTTVLPF